MLVQRQFVYLADLNPRMGSEPGKVRPVIVLQTNLLNNRHPSTIICPLTTKLVDGVSILRVRLKKGQAGLSRDSDIMVDQIRAMDNRRFVKSLDRVPTPVFERVLENLTIVLDLKV